MNSFALKHSDRIDGVLSCFDRVVLSGTLPEICYAKAMERYLANNSIRIFDFPKLANGWRETIRKNTERIADRENIEIEFVRKNSFRKEARVKEIIKKRGDHEGLICILSAMETCTAYKPHYDKCSGNTSLRTTSSKCLHYYFYFIDRILGTCYLRVPTWAPFRLQVYFNGHNWLARRLEKLSIGYHLEDNAFIDIENFKKAQKLADDFDVKSLQKRLNGFVRRFCPLIRKISNGCHWSIMQLEYATDLVFSSQKSLAPLYEELIRTSVHAVKCDNIATFLGKKTLDGRFKGEAGSLLARRIEGRKIRHTMGPASIKMYDKFALVLRIETTCNDVTFFKHHRRVEYRDGGYRYKIAPVCKSIFSLPDLRKIMKASNERYLDFLSSITDPTPGVRSLERIVNPVREGERSWRGFNPFNQADLQLLLAIARGEFNVAGFDNRGIRGILAGKSASQISRMFKRLRVHGLIRKVRKRYRYNLTVLGQKLILIALKLRQDIVLPGLTPALAGKS